MDDKDEPQLSVRNSQPGLANNDAAPRTLPEKEFARWAAIFGGSSVKIGPRTLPIAPSLRPSRSVSLFSENSEDVLLQQLKDEETAEIKYRSCSWLKTAALLFSEYICLAIMSFPGAYSEMGWVCGLLATLANAMVYQYTSLVLWEFCLRHPEVRDICDIGCIISGGKPWAWWGTAVMFVLNNTFVAGLHVIVGSVYLNTITGDWHPELCKTVLFCVLITILSWLGSLARTFSMLSHLGTISAAFTFMSVLLAAIFIAIQAKPANYDPRTLYTAPDGTKKVGGDPIFSPWPATGVTFTSFVVAFLNISYTFIGQIALPSFIAEMKDPRDFPKALWTCTVAQVVVFSTVGMVIYKYTGTQYMTSPAFGGLEKTYKLISFSFMIPTIIFLGVLYASITGRFVFFRLYRNSEHMRNHTVKGWLSWGGILLVFWIIAFFVSQLIPFFSALLALMGSVFDAFFGFIFFSIAWFRMRNKDKKDGRKVRSKHWDCVLIVVNVLIFIIGLGFFLVGTYASVRTIMDMFVQGTVQRVFSCSSNAL
ncbi:hypothetical protein G7046_g1312 [Stylonectria norvegica]|nr:hypothetical protein G7046_g1312 [Stylonectria norvegica]